MELSEEIKNVAEFWFGFQFLKKYKESGKKYLEQIKSETESVGVENEQRKS